MTQPTPPTALRHHLYPDSFYGETPLLAMPRADNAASNLARLMVKLGVDGRGPQAEPASAEELVAGIPRLLTMHRAAVGAGFMVDVRLAESDGTGTVRAQYTYAPNEAGVTVADKPPYAPGRIFNLRWALDDGLYAPQEPVFTGSKEPPDLDVSARVYAELWSRVMDAASDSPLGVVKARLNPYQSLSSRSVGAAAATERQA